MATITQPTLVRNGNERWPTTMRSARAEVLVRARSVMALCSEQAATGTLFAAFEKALVAQVFALGRAAVVLFLIASEQRVRASLTPRVSMLERVFRVAPAQWRSLLTWFRVVRYERTYLREVVAAGVSARGYHPLDAELGLLADRVSPNLLQLAVRLATRVSFSEACELLGWFLPSVPSTEVVEAALLGYGRHTEAWFEHAPAPQGDGEVLVIQLDGKGVPTATEAELRKRRGKRNRRKSAPSARHRGRQARQRWQKKPHRNKGDKAKNAKMGTMSERTGSLDGDRRLFDQKKRTTGRLKPCRVTPPKAVAYPSS